MRNDPLGVCASLHARTTAQDERLRKQRQRRSAIIIVTILLIVYLLGLANRVEAHPRPAEEIACDHLSTSTGCVRFMEYWAAHEGCAVYGGHNPLCMKINGRLVKYPNPQVGGRAIVCQIDHTIQPVCDSRQLNYQYPVIAEALRGGWVTETDLVVDLERWCTSCADRRGGYIYPLAAWATAWQHKIL